MLNADPTKVSQRAKKRGLPQVRTSSGSQSSCVCLLEDGNRSTCSLHALSSVKLAKPFNVWQAKFLLSSEISKPCNYYVYLHEAI